MKNSNKDLMELALQATNKNVTTSKSKKSINDHLFEMLFEGKRSMTRKAIINEISYKRFEEEVGEITKDNLEEAIKSGQWASINKTVKNGLDTAVCNGKTSASFCSNPSYSDYELIKTSDKIAIEAK